MISYTLDILPQYNPLSFACHICTRSKLSLQKSTFRQYFFTCLRFVTIMMFFFIWYHLEISIFKPVSCPLSLKDLISLQISERWTHMISRKFISKCRNNIKNMEYNEKRESFAKLFYKTKIVFDYFIFVHIIIFLEQTRIEIPQKIQRWI